MKKFLKLLFLFLLTAIIIIAIVFNKRIFLSYGIVEKYITLKDRISQNQNLDMKATASSMNYNDIEYKNTNGKPLTLDIYGPIKKVYDSSPVILYVHGGSFAYGDKSIPNAFSPVLDTFREQGYTIISTSYELMRNKENFNKQISDVKDTIRWIYKNKSTYNLDTNEIGVFGLSSGAYLSLMAGYSSDSEFIDDPELSNYPSKIKYLIDFSGPTDLSLLKTNNLNYDLSRIFSSIKNVDATIEKYNPIKYVNSIIPNTLIIHSKLDNVVPFESSEELYNKCLESKAKVEFIPLNSTDHDLSNISKDDVVAISEGLLKFVVLNSPL